MRKSRYKYRIVEIKEEWRFELLPCNNNQVPFGYSDFYLSREEALQGLNRFRTFMQREPWEKQCEHTVTTVLWKDKPFKKYGFRICFSANGEHFTKARGYDTIGECQKGLERLSKNFDADLRIDL